MTAVQCSGGRRCRNGTRLPLSQSKRWVDAPTAGQDSRCACPFTYSPLLTRTLLWIASPKSGQVRRRFPASRRGDGPGSRSSSDPTQRIPVSAESMAELHLAPPVSCARGIIDLRIRGSEASGVCVTPHPTVVDEVVGLVKPRSQQAVTACRSRSGFGDQPDSSTGVLDRLLHEEACHGTNRGRPGAADKSTYAESSAASRLRSRADLVLDWFSSRRRSRTSTWVGGSTDQRVNCR